VHLKADWKPA